MLDEGLFVRMSFLISQLVEMATAVLDWLGRRFEDTMGGEHLESVLLTQLQGLHG